MYYNKGIRLPPAAERQEVSYNVRKLTHLSGSSSCFLFSFFSTDISRFVLSMLHSRTCTDKSCALSRNDGSSILQNVKHFIRHALQHDTRRPAILLVIFQDLSVKLVLPLINGSCKTKLFCLESHPMSQKLKQAKWLHYYLGAPSHFSLHSLLNDCTTLSSCSRL